MSDSTTTHEGRRRGRVGAVLITMAVVIACLGATAPAASAAPKWSALTYWAPSTFQPGERGGIRLEVGNVGDETAMGWPTVEIELPEGFEFDENNTMGGFGWSCTPAGTPETVTCANPLAGFFEPLWPKPNTYVGWGFPFNIEFTVDVSPSAPTGMQPLVARLAGSGATETTTVEEQVRVGGPAIAFGIREGSFRAAALDEEGNPYTQAGGRPHEVVSSFFPNLKLNDPPNPSDPSEWPEFLEPVKNVKNILVEAPAGFAGDALAVPRCTPGKVSERNCPPETQIGVAETNNVVSPQLQMQAVYNVVPQKGTPAQFMFATGGGPVLLTPVLQSDGEWSLRVDVRNITEANPLFHGEVKLWGVPADSSHDIERCPNPSHVGGICAGWFASGSGPPEGETDPNVEPHPSTAPRRALLTNPTECDGQPQTSYQHNASWLDPAPFTLDGDPDLSDPRWITASYDAPPLTGCEALELEPTLKARPTTDAADSPTGLDVDLHIPQNMDPDGLATAHLRDVTVTLPKGLVINPSGANGLGACSEDQANLDTRLPDDCPEDARIGKVLVETPVLANPLQGAVYVAAPHDNPFDSLLAIYVTIDDPQTGIVGKIAGEVQADPETGRLTAIFKRNPQLPFEDFHLDFFGGATAPLRTPVRCGDYATRYGLTPWSAPHSGPPLTGADAYELTKGPGGRECLAEEEGLPNSPSFDAGSSSPIAGAHSPFVIELNRADGTQQFRSVTVTPPRGLLATLAGTATCSDGALAAAARKDGREEQASPSCPAASQIGTVVAAAAAGPAPYHAQGAAYLTGPYKGAPISLAIVTPAVAGPFDLGTIVVRSALHLDPRTAQITAVSDEIPHILEGIPLDIRSVSVRIDRPGFTLNPTSCDESQVGGSLLSTLGQSVDLSERFQVGECDRLRFKPRLKLNLRGGHQRGDYQRLRAELRMPSGSANIARASVSLPSAFFLAQEHLDNICTRVQFAADKCPRASIYGTAKAITPLLEEPLSGPVYLRSSDNTLPDLVAALRGPDDRPIEVELVGRTDSKNRGIRNTFDLVPDAPVTRFVLNLKGGSHSLIVNSTDICRNPQRATASFEAHNGRTRTIRPKMKTRCGKGKARERRGKDGGR